MRLIDVSKLAWKHAQKKRKEGSVPTFLGLDGMLALMYDNIRRFHQEKGTLSYNEVLDMAANAIFALEVVCDRVLPGGTDDFNSIPISEEYPTHTPQLLPQPERFDGWNFDPKKAKDMKKWLVETNQWGLLPEDQQLGIEEIIHGDTDTGGQEDEESEDEEESEEEEQESEEV